eukprot:scaffold881_cov123-Isochrysis_galbana.AAC.4
MVDSGRGPCRGGLAGGGGSERWVGLANWKAYFKGWRTERWSWEAWEAPALQLQRCSTPSSIQHMVSECTVQSDSQSGSQRQGVECRGAARHICCWCASVG